MTERESIRIDRWPIPEPEFELGSAPAALLVVDMQEMAVRRDRGLGKLVGAIPDADEYFFGRVDGVIARQGDLLSHFRKTGRPVVFVTIGPHADDGSDLVPWKLRRNEEMKRRAGVEYTVSSDDDHVIIGELAPREGEVVFNKATFGAFSSTGLDHLLRNWGIRQLVVCGQATNVCVYMTAAEAADRGYECVVPGDACAAWNRILHEAFLENFRLLFGRVADSGEVIAELGASSTEGRGG